MSVNKIKFVKKNTSDSERVVHIALLLNSSIDRSLCGLIVVDRRHRVFVGHWSRVATPASRSIEIMAASVWTRRVSLQRICGFGPRPEVDGTLGRHDDDEIDEVLGLWHDHGRLQSGAPATATARTARSEYLRRALCHRHVYIQQVQNIHSSI